MQAVWKLALLWALVFGFVGGASLTAVSVLSSPAYAGDNGDMDADNDQITDNNDNCPFTPNTNQNDTNGNGRGDACECGDFNGDGSTNTTDARLAQRCAVGQLACVALGDVNCDGVVNTTDARLMQRFAVGQLTLDDLTCAELLGTCL